MTRVITFGTFDVLHIGHVALLERAAELGSHLTVGVSTDKLNMDKKGRMPVYLQDERLAMVKALRCVDEVFYEESLEEKPNYLRMFQADILVMGDDWAGKFDALREICRVVYLPRTPAVSTTALIEKIRR